MTHTEQAILDALDAHRVITAQVPFLAWKFDVSESTIRRSLKRLVSTKAIIGVGEPKPYAYRRAEYLDR